MNILEEQANERRIHRKKMYDKVFEDQVKARQCFETIHTKTMYLADWFDRRLGNHWRAKPFTDDEGEFIEAVRQMELHITKLEQENQQYKRLKEQKW